ncbi:hypothetical protein [Caulobacter soli]|uniref:hypothetical protein n=1 Tax=Caulobacter soli TaxID=2708539 RepID=UPI0013ED6D61|nr:hypothetical protein [Caulobacter soli]
MSQLLTAAQQRSLQMILHDLDELGRDLFADGKYLVVSTRPLPSADRYTAEVSKGFVVEAFTWQRP